MSDAELDAKFCSLAEYGAPALDAARLIEAVWGIDREPNAAGIIKITAP